MKYLIFIIVIVISVILYTNNKVSIYNEGEWNSISYVGVDKHKEKVMSRIKIVRSQAIVLKDRIRLLVYFKINNTENYPISFGWKNKYLISQDALSFIPIRGTGVNNLQPYTESKELYTEYKLPTYVDMKKIYWGLYDTSSHSIRYQILLKPYKLDKAEEHKPTEITFDRLLIEVNDLIGTEVKIICKGNQFMQIKLNQKKFNASCENIDNPYPSINYELAFKYKNSLLSTIYHIKNKSEKFYVTGKVEWPDNNDFMSKIIIDADNIEIFH